MQMMRNIIINGQKRKKQKIRILCGNHSLFSVGENSWKKERTNHDFSLTHKP